MGGTDCIGRSMGAFTPFSTGVLLRAISLFSGEIRATEPLSALLRPARRYHNLRLRARKAGRDVIGTNP
jgi:hypothetical protein